MKRQNTVKKTTLPTLSRLQIFLWQKLPQAIFVAWASFTLVFIILYILPGDPVSLMLGGNGDAQIDKEALAQLRAQYGYDRPVLIRYIDALLKALRLDFGTSVVTGKPVIDSFFAALPATASLAGLSLLLSVILGTLIAILSTNRQSGLRTASLFSKLPPFFVSTPSFVIGLILIQVFSFRLHWLPALGNGTFKQLILPALAMAIPAAGMLAQILSKSLRQTYGDPFVRMMRAKGFSEGRILWHALRNASLPAFTMAGLIVGNTLSGSVVTETVFSRQGIGRLIQMGVEHRDINLICGLIVFSALVYVVISLLIDVLSPLLDPRIKI